MALKYLIKKKINKLQPKKNTYHTQFGMINGTECENQAFCDKDGLDFSKDDSICVSYNVIMNEIKNNKKVIKKLLSDDDDELKESAANTIKTYEILKQQQEIQKHLGAMDLKTRKVGIKKGFYARKYFR